MGWLRDIVNEAESAVRSHFEDPLGQLNPLTVLDQNFGMMGASWGIGRGGINKFLGIGAKGPTLNQQLAELDDSRRREILGDALNDKNIDDISRHEIIDIFNTGGRVDQLTTKLEAARAGKGIYAVRKVSQAQRMMVRDMPGRRQLRST